MGVIKPRLTRAPLVLTSLSAAVKPLILKGAAGQTANLAEFQNSAGTVVSAIDGTGKAVGTGFAKTIRVPHTFTISGEVKVAVGDEFYIPPFFVPVPAGQTVKIRNMRSRINSGTSVTLDLHRNGVAFSTNYSVTTTSNTHSDLNSIDLTDGDRLSVVVTAISGTPKNMTFAVYLDYSV